MDCVPSNVQSSRQEALLYVFEDNEAVVKMIIKGRSPTMRHVSRTHRVALDWLFDRINLDPKIQIKDIDTKNQLADILTKGTFTRDEWNHLLCLLNISHFSSTVCSETLAKRLQQDSGEETSHSKTATNDEPHCKGAIERIILDFSKPGEEKLWNQDPWSKNAEKEERPGRPDVGSDRKTASDSYHAEFIESSFLSMLLKVGWKPCLVFSRVENWYWDVRAIGETRCNFLVNDTRIPTRFLSRGNSAWWNRAIRCEWGNTSWDIGASWYRFSRRGMASTIRHWKRWSRITKVSRIKIIRESGEWSSAEKTETNFKCHRRWRETFHDLGNVHDCNNGIGSFHGKELPEQLSIHCKHNRSHTQTNVRHIYKIGVWTRWDLWCEYN